MKKGFSLIETIVVILIFTIISLVGIKLLSKLSLKASVDNNSYYKLANNCDLILMINNKFNIYKTINYEIINEELYLTNGNHFLYFLKDKIVFDLNDYDVVINKFNFKNNELLEIEFRDDFHLHKMMIRGEFREIHSD